MPQVIANRLWCQECKDWTLFFKNIGEKDGIKCHTCQTVHVATILSEIPEQKLLEQRQRYKADKSRQFREAFGMMQALAANPRGSVPGVNEIDRIIESDAGQRALDEYEKQLKAEVKKAATEEVVKHRNLGRNDKCICSSGKKYKNCCLKKVNELQVKHRVF